MNKRVVWLALGFAALVVAAAMFLREPPPDRDQVNAVVTTVPAPAASRPLPPAPAPTTQAVPAPPDLLLAAPLTAKKTGPFAIEDGKTIDFSTGLPLVRESEKDKAVVARAVKELEDAVRGVTFGSPTAPAPASAPAPAANAEKK